MMESRDGGDLYIRNFETGDIPFALEQTGREGWDSTSASFEALLLHDPEGCFLATCGGQVAGMVTTTQYAESAWIGNLIVPPEFRRRSIGAALMRHGIRYLESRGAHTIRLEADPMGINIYRRLGFRDQYDSPRYRNDHDFGGESRAGVLGPSDLEDACVLDRRIFGDDRRRLLGLLLRNTTAAFRYPSTGPVLGYLYVQASKDGCRLGPWVALDNEIARELLHAAAGIVASRSAIVALPGLNAGGMQLLESSGFYRTPSSLRMVLGPPVAEGIPEQVYGIAGGAIG